MKNIFTVLLLVFAVSATAQISCPRDAFRDMVYAISAIVDPLFGGGTVSGGGNYSYGASCTLVATPYQAYRFVCWKRDGTVVSLDRVAQFTVTEDATYTAYFEEFGCQSDELDYSVYDWQSNSGARTWTHAWADGKVSFAYTVCSDVSMVTRGTGIETYDAATGTWQTSDGRVEYEKTGFGSIAQYGANSIVVAAHTPNDCRIYLVPNKDNVVAYTASPISILDNTYQPSWPAVMTSGPNRDIIHVVANAYVGTVPGSEGVRNPILYFRSSDGGQTWDRENVVLPFMDADNSLAWETNSCYWMETSEDNCLALVVNNPWSDGMVLYSYDDGNTWERKLFYQHPNPLEIPLDSVFYPRWTSCQWDDQHHLHVLYAFTALSGSPGSHHDFPAIGGVAYWNETMSFVLDNDYLHDLYNSLWLFPDAPHEMNPVFIGYLPPLTDDGTPEDPYNATSCNIYPWNMENHGNYGQGVCAFPVLCMVPGTNEMVAVWSAMDENHLDDNEFFFYKLFASYSGDGGATWSPMVHLTNLPSFSLKEFVYNQAVVVGRTLIVVSEADENAGSFIEADENDPSDNYFQGLVFDIDDLFETAHNQDHTITAEAVPASMGSVAGAVTAPYGTSCSLVATPNDGCYFVKWTRDDAIVSTKPTFNFIVTEDAHYVAHFAYQPVLYHITVSNAPVQGGTVTGAGIYESGSVCTLTAEPAIGYEFVRWARNGILVSTSPSFSFTVTQDLNLVAEYDHVDVYYSVTVTTDPPGCGQVTGGGNYHLGSTAMVTVIPHDHYAFDHWTMNGEEVSTCPVYSFTVLDDAHLVAHLSSDDDVADHQSSVLSVAPNPVNDKLYLQGASIHSVKVFNTLGQLVLSQECDSAENVELNLNVLGAGVYTVAVRLDNGCLVNKLVVKE